MNFISGLIKKLIKQFKNYYSFVIVPNTHKKYFELRIRKLYLHLILLLLLGIGVYSLGLSILNQKINSEVEANATEIVELETKDAQQKKYISQLEDNLQIMNEKLGELEDLETYIKNITGYNEEEEKQEEN